MVKPDLVEGVALVQDSVKVKVQEELKWCDGIGIGIGSESRAGSKFTGLLASPCFYRTSLTTGDELLVLLRGAIQVIGKYVFLYQESNNIIVTLSIYG